MTIFQWVTLPIWIWLGACIALDVWIIRGWFIELWRDWHRMEGLATQFSKWQHPDLVVTEDFLAKSRIEQFRKAGLLAGKDFHGLD